MVSIVELLKAMAMTIVSSLVLIILSIIYFGITIWVVKVASEFFFGPGLDANWAVVAASLITLGSLVSATLECKVVRR